MRVRLKGPKYSMIQNVKFWLNQSDDRDTVPVANWVLVVYALLFVGLVIWFAHTASQPWDQV